MDIKQIVELLGAGLANGGAGAAISAINQALILINKLTEDDPVKQTKAKRELFMSLFAIIKEVSGAEDSTDIVRRFTDLLNES